MVESLLNVGSQLGCKLGYGVDYRLWHPSRGAGAWTSFQGERMGPNAPSRSCKWRLKVDWWVSVGKWITVQSINEGTLLETWLLFAAWVSLKEFVKQWLSQTNSVYGLACWSARPQDSETAGHCNGHNAFCFLEYIPLTVTVWKQRRTRRNYSIYLWLKQIWICVAACLWILTNKKKSHHILHFNFGVVPQTSSPLGQGKRLVVPCACLKSLSSWREKRAGQTGCYPYKVVHQNTYTHWCAMEFVH